MAAPSPADVIAAERIERDAYADLAAAGAPVTRVVDAGVPCTVVPPIPVPFLNRALAVGVDAPATEELLDAVVEAYAGAGVRYAVPVAPVARPPELAGWLAARGFRPGYAWAKFWRAPGILPAAPGEPPVLRLEPGEGEAFAAVVLEAYGMPAAAGAMVRDLPGRPGWTCYLALVDGEPAAAGALFVGDGVGWLGVAGTRPALRRRGGQGAIMRARLADAAAAGCRLAVTETGEDVPERPSSSYRNIVRHGFVERYVRPNFESPAP